MVTPQPPLFPPTGKSGECILTGFLSQLFSITDSQNRGRDTNDSFHLLSCLYPSFRVCIMNSLLYCFSQHWYVSEIRKKILSSSSERCATHIKKWLIWFCLGFWERTVHYILSLPSRIFCALYLFLQVSFISSTLLSRKQQAASFTDLYLTIQTALILEQSPNP